MEKEIKKICLKCGSYMLATRVDEHREHWWCPLCGRKEPEEIKISWDDKAKGNC